MSSGLTNAIKLNGIENAATADQTDLEIKTGYENNTNTNEYDDTEQTKLATFVNGTQYLRNDIDNTLAGELTISKNVGTASAYNTGQLELICTDAGDVSLGFHRSGSTACQLRHESNGLILSGVTPTTAANFYAYGSITGSSLITAGNISGTSLNIDGGSGSNAVNIDNNQITFYNGSAQSATLNLYDTSEVLAFTIADLRTSGSFTATGNVTAYSDKRVKKNIEVISNAMDKILTLSGYTFDRTDIDTKRQTGVIAQEVQKVLPEVVKEDDEGMLSVAYGNMVGLLIEGMKEQQKEIDYLKSKIKG